MRHGRLARARPTILASIVLAAGVAACGGGTADDAKPTTTLTTVATATTTGADATAPDTTRPVISGEAPRSDTPIYPGAELVKENTYQVAIDEIYATSAALDDVIEFYAAIPGFESIAGSSLYTDDARGSLETEVSRLVVRGAPEAEISAEVERSGPLMILHILPSDAPLLGTMFLSGELADQLPQGSTVIVMRVLTG